MSDVVVCVPKTFRWDGAPGRIGLAAWAAEGDVPGSVWSGAESFFWIGRNVPRIEPGDRVYICCQGKLRGYAPLVRVETALHVYDGGRSVALVRHGGAVAVTIPQPIPGFRGFRYRFWNREDERPFPNWRVP